MTKAKVFIYDARGCAPQSVGDAKKLFSEYGIADAVDVTTTNLSQSFDGLKSSDFPVLVIPGGSAVAMGAILSGLSANQQPSALWQRGFHIIGLCAGAYLAPADSQIFQTPHAPKFLFSGQDCGISFGLVQDFIAYGPFSPIQAVVRPTSEAGVPLRVSYRVQLQVNESKKIESLYVEGCGFVPDLGKPWECEVVAEYPAKHYSFFYPEQKAVKAFDNMSAIIRRKKREGESKGSLLLSGVHLESCVEGSEMLNAFNPETPARGCASLSTHDFGLFKREQADSRREVVALIKDTLSLR